MIKEQFQPLAIGSLWLPGQLLSGQRIGNYRVISELQRERREEAPSRLDVSFRRALKQTEIIRLPQHSPSRWRLIGPRGPLGCLGVIAAAAVIVLVGLWGWRQVRSQPTSSRAHLLVIAPFKLSTANQGLSEGLARAVGETLARVPELQVVTQPLPAPNTEDGWIVKNLGASLILRGSMERTADQTRIEYSLVDVSGRELERGTVTRRDSFSALERVVEEVAQSIGLKSPLQPEPDQPPPSRLDPAAQDRYLEALGDLPGAQPFGGGEAPAGQPEEASLKQAIQLLSDIVKSPEGAQAVYHAALARVYAAQYALTSEYLWFGMAKETCDRAQELDRNLHQAQSAIGRVNLELGRYQSAIDNFRAELQRQPSNLPAKLGLAEAYNLNRQFPEAEGAFREAIALSPAYWNGYHEMGYFYYTQGRYAEAAEQWQRVVQLVPGRELGHTNLGQVYLNQGHLDAAVASYRQSLGIGQTLAGYVGLGTVLYYQGNYEEAIKVFNQGLQLKPNDPVLLGGLGDAYRQASNSRDAAKAYDQAIGGWQNKFDTGQTYPDEMARQADCLAKRGRAAEAREKIQLALELAPENTNCMYSAAIVYKVGGDRYRALTWAKRAIESGYSAILFKLEPELAKLRTDPGFDELLHGNQP